MKLEVLIALFIFSLLSCKSELKSQQNKARSEEGIIGTYLKNGAWNHHFLTKEWDDWINKGIQEDSTIAYLWQQKALPFWKQRKYSLAISFYDKAVELDKQQWLSRLGFLKCIFAKDYVGALTDLIAYRKEFGSTYEQDHSLEFYMGICYLQLNQYEKAITILEETINNDEVMNGIEWVHYLDRFYLAVSYYELQNYEKSISEFDKVLKEYPSFSDAQYYKSMCLKNVGKIEEAKLLMAEGKLNFEKGYSFNEDSSKYEVYPYQVVWQWGFINSILRK